MKKEPFYFDKEKFTLLMSDVESEKEKIQTLVNSYDNFRKIAGLPELEKEELKTLHDNAELFISQKIVTKNNLSLNGMPIKLNKLFDLIDRPEGMDGFLEVYNQLRYGIFDLNKFNVNDNIVEVKKSVEDQFRDSCSFFATTERQKEYLTQLNQIADSLNKLRAINGGELYVPDTLKEAFGLDPVNQMMHHKTVFAVNPLYILRQ